MSVSLTDLACLALQITQTAAIFGLYNYYLRYRLGLHQSSTTFWLINLPNFPCTTFYFGMSLTSNLFSFLF